jgi:TonB family protein
MEILNLTSLNPDEDYADGTPRFFLTPDARLPAMRFVQGCGTQAVILGALLLSAWIFAPAASGPRPRPAPRDDGGTVTTLYVPRPVLKIVTHEVPQKAQKNERRRFAIPLAAEQPAARPTIDPPPPILAALPDQVPAIPNSGFRLPPAPAPAIFQVQAGPPKAPPARLPGLDPSAPRTASSPLSGTGAGRDPLAPAGPRFTDKSRGGGGGNGLADLSATTLGPPAPRRSQPAEVAFTKPEISFMPKLVYPPAALAEQIEGDVHLQVTFDKAGQVIFRHFIRELSNAELNSVARETVERIKFVPAMRDGVPVDQDSVVVVFFRLTQINMTASF